MTHRPAKYLLAWRGIPQRQIARTYGTSAPYINDVLAGRKKPSRELRAHIAETLGLDESIVWPEFNHPEKEEGPANQRGPQVNLTKGANLDRSDTCTPELSQIAALARAVARPGADAMLIDADNKALSSVTHDELEAAELYYLGGHVHEVTLAIGEELVEAGMVTEVTEGEEVSFVGVPDWRPPVELEELGATTAMVRVLSNRGPTIGPPQCWGTAVLRGVSGSATPGA